MVGGVSVVIPTVGRQSLAVTLGALAVDGPPSIPAEILLVDDRRDPHPPLAPGPGPERRPAQRAAAWGGPVRWVGDLAVLPEVPGVPIRVLAGPGAGPAAARNVGWRAASHPWVAYLDDDVIPDPGWWSALAADLDAPVGVGGVQGRVRVPLPAGRRPTDWERSTAGLAEARWITADMAYRRAALAAAGGFDERFPRAYREDAELAYRVRRAGWRLAVGKRGVAHPVRPEGPWMSLRAQRGNADDALLRRLYGRHWRRLLEVPPGRRPRHVAVTTAGLAALVAAVSSRRPAARAALAVSCLTWLGGTAELAAARIAPGPRTPHELATMAVTSAFMPPLATYHWLRGWWSHRGARPLTLPPGPGR